MRGSPGSAGPGVSAFAARDRAAPRPSKSVDRPEKSAETRRRGRDTAAMAAEDERKRFAEAAKTQIGPVDEPRALDLHEDADLPADGSGRYERQGDLGAGGMGEVALCLDHVVGRQVAMKVAHADLLQRRDVRARFLLEAKLQAQLEHPAIVPVYDLGRADGGAPYFTMRRVRGLTLEQVLDARHDGDAEVLERFGERRLLTLFAQLCLALDFVHERGVVHRDLKPANVMFGEYGEVYLLDWGLAKVLGAEDFEGDGDLHRPSPHRGLRDSAPQTHFEQILGTPGYVAPELVGSERVAPSPRADLYALGALLFEIVTGERLHRGDSLMALIHSTRAGVEPRLQEVADELPPELASLARAATCLDPAERMSSARVLHEGIERYLDGHRDSERRRLQADALVAEVRASDAEGDTARREALAKLGRALALDPTHRGALEGLVARLTEPPDELPAEVRRELRDQEGRQTRQAGRIGAVVFLGLNLFVPLAILTGLRTWLPVILFAALTTATGLASALVSRLPEPTTRSATLVFGLALATASSTSVLFGPFLIAPLMVVVVTLLFTLNHPPHYRLPFVAMGLVAALLPLGLELAEVVPASMAFEGEGLRVLPRTSEMARLPTLALLTLVSLATIAIAGGAIGPIRSELDRSHARIRLQAWQLRQLVPASSTDGVEREVGGPERTDAPNA